MHRKHPHLRFVTNDGDGGGSGDQGGKTGGGDEFKPITSQDDLNRIITERVSRERAKFADYSDLKDKAGRLDELEAANKSEVEKANDKASKAEAEVAKLPQMVTDALRGHLVGLHKIPQERAELYLTATDPELLLKQVAGLVDLDTDRKKQGNRVPGEGANPKASESDERTAVRDLFGSGA